MPGRQEVSIAALLGVLLLGAGCDREGDGAATTVVSCAAPVAPPLDDVNALGEYDPYFVTGDMNTPRYFHAFLNARGGSPVVLGGSDERGLSGLDSVEIFDQATYWAGTPWTESGTGQWIDTDFEGDTMALENGPRLLSTVSKLPDGSVLVAGGAPDLLSSRPHARAEIFDPVTRTFTTLENEMAVPRFRHGAVTLADGSILIAGGQVMDCVVIEPLDLFCLPFPVQMMFFSSTPSFEVFSPVTREFAVSTRSRLATPRGRAGHAMARLAGPDRELRSADDVFIIAGGMETSMGQFAPRTKFHGSVGRFEALGLTSIEVFDPATGAFTEVQNVSLASPRLNDPHIVNLGEFNDFTIDGVKGMGNLVLIAHGNADQDCPATPAADELVSASFTGFGPAGGFQLFIVEDGGTGGHVQGMEHGQAAVAGRCATNPVAMVRRLRTRRGTAHEQTWVVAAGGMAISPREEECIHDGRSATLAAGAVFDPHFSLPAALAGLSPRDLRGSRTSKNPLGVVGTWLTLDGLVPAGSLEGFGEHTPPARWARITAPARIFGANLPVAGEDQILRTADDRLLLAGGGDDYALFGGEPAAPSSELLILPFANERRPAP
jgi:hypothetical protein